MKYRDETAFRQALHSVTLDQFAAIVCPERFARRQ